MAARRTNQPKTPADAAKVAERKAADLSLMQRVASEADGAVEDLYERFGSLVYRMSYQAMPTTEEAEDAVQEVFVRLWKTADRYDPARAALVTWVMLITRRHLVDKLRRKRARISAGALDESQLGAGQIGGGKVGRAEVAEAGIEHDEKFAAVMERIGELPELQRAVVTRAYLRGQTLRKIGEELDTPLGTIKSALSRALVRLRERTSEELAT